MDTTVGLIVGLILAVITIVLILWGSGKEKSRIDAAQQASSTVPAAKVPEAFAAVAAAPAVPAAVAAAPALETAAVDDLIIIEGIGPKIAGLLNQHGITTFAGLAAAEVTVLETLLKENGLQFVKPASWPEQARLAAEGKMDELKALQDRLVAGR